MEHSNQTPANLQALSFMVAQFGDIHLDDGGVSGSHYTDAANFRNIYATIKYLADQLH